MGCEPEGIGSFMVAYASDQSNLDFRMIPDKPNIEVVACNFYPHTSTTIEEFVNL
jgi:hypothetical protein